MFVWLCSEKVKGMICIKTNLRKQGIFSVGIYPCSVHSVAVQVLVLLEEEWIAQE